MILTNRTHLCNAWKVTRMCAYIVVALAEDDADLSSSELRSTDIQTFQPSELLHGVASRLQVPSVHYSRTLSTTRHWCMQTCR